MRSVLDPAYRGSEQQKVLAIGKAAHPVLIDRIKDEVRDFIEARDERVAALPV